MKEQKPKNDRHFLFIPNILHNICQHLTEASDVANLAKCHKKIEAYLYHTTLDVGLSLKDPLCSRTSSVKQLKKVIRHLSPNWTVLYIVFDFSDHCVLCHLKLIKMICRFKNMKFQGDREFMRRIMNYTGQIYCSIYKQDEIFDKILDADSFYNVFRELKHSSESKTLDGVPNGMPIEVPPIRSWFGGSDESYCFSYNGVLTLPGSAPP